MSLSVESIASSRKQTKEAVRVGSLIPSQIQPNAEKLMELLEDYYSYLNEPGNPSNEISRIAAARDIDTADYEYLDEIQKEIAISVPRKLAETVRTNPFDTTKSYTVNVNRVTLYKNLMRYYSIRGSQNSIALFFKIIFDDNVEIYYPKESMLIPSSGSWSPGELTTAGQFVENAFYTITFPGNTDFTDCGADDSNIGTVFKATSAGTGTGKAERRGQYSNQKGFLSDNIKLQDSYFYQEFSYVIRTGQNISAWENVFNRLVHPAGFIFFGQIQILIEQVNHLSTINSDDGRIYSSMLYGQPGLIANEDIPYSIIIDPIGGQDNEFKRQYFSTYDIIRSGDFQIGKTYTIVSKGGTLKASGTFEIGKTYVIESVGGVLVTGGNFVVGKTYTIVVPGTDSNNFTLLGAANNNVGTVFVATGTGTNSIGRGIARYGNANFTAIGSANNDTGTTFVATGVGNYEANTVAGSARSFDDITDFILLGAADNEVGTVFVATATGAENITAGNFVVGKTYKIITPGTTNFTLVGAENSSINTVFLATGIGSGTGVVKHNPGTGTAKEQRIHTVTLKPAEPDRGTTTYWRMRLDIEKTDAGSFETGESYIITSNVPSDDPEYTDFTDIGAGDNDIGTVFTATGPGSGGGTAIINPSNMMKFYDGVTVKGYRNIRIEDASNALGYGNLYPWADYTISDVINSYATQSSPQIIWNDIHLEITLTPT